MMGGAAAPNTLLHATPRDELDEARRSPRHHTGPRHDAATADFLARRALPVFRFPALWPRRATR